MTCSYSDNAAHSFFLSGGANNISFVAYGGGGGGGGGQSGNGGGGAGNGSGLAGSLPNAAAGHTMYLGAGSQGHGRGSTGTNGQSRYGNFNGGDGGDGTYAGGAGGSGGAASVIGYDDTLLVVAGGGGGGGGTHHTFISGTSTGGRGGDGSTGGGNGNNTYGNGGGGGSTGGAGGGGGAGGYHGGNGGGGGGAASGGNGGQGGGDAALNGASKYRPYDTAADGSVSVSWYRSASTISPSMPGGTVYAWQKNLSIPYSINSGATGTVTVTDTSTNTQWCSTAISSGTTCSVGGSKLTGGSHTLRFDYDGDSGYASTSTTRTLNVSGDPVSVAISPTKQSDGTYAFAVTASPGITDGIVDGALSLTASPASSALTSSCATVLPPAASEGRRNLNVTLNCTPAMRPGTYVVSASFQGNATSASASSSTTVTIDKYTPTIGLTLAPTVLPSFGSTTTATVKVDQPSYAQTDVAGTVTLAPASGSGPGCTATLVGKVGLTTTYSCSFAPNAGERYYTATYGGNSDYKSVATDGTTLVTTTAATPTLTLVPSASTIGVGKPLSLTIAATDKGGADLATGTVSVYDGPVAPDASNLVGSIDLAGSAGGGVLTPTPSPEPGSHVYTAQYIDAAGNYDKVTVAAIPVVVQPLRAVIDVTATGDNTKATAAGIPVTVTTTITMDPKDALDNDITSSPTPASCDSMQRKVVGDDRIVSIVCHYVETPGTVPTYTATYRDALVGVLTGQQKTFVVPASPTSISATATDVKYGRRPVLSATVTPTVASTDVVGTVEFSQDGDVLCTNAVTVDNGVGSASCPAHFTDPAKPHAGSHAVTARFVPDVVTHALTLGSTSDAVSYAVSREPVSIVMYTSQTATKLTISASARVDGNDPGAPTPTGSVVFSNAASDCGSKALQGGLATCVIDLPAAGAKATLTGTLAPSDDFKAGTSPTSTINFQRPSSGPCSTGFNNVWSRALKALNGTLNVDAGDLGSIKLSIGGGLGLCDAAATLSVSAEVDLLSGTLSASNLTASVTQNQGLCLTSGSLSMPAVWRSGALSITQAICMRLTDTGTFGQPYQGELALGNNGSATLPLLTIPGVTGAASLTARLGTACPGQEVSSTGCATKTSAVTVTANVAAASASVPGVTVVATVGAGGRLDGSVTSTSMNVLGTSIQLAGSISRDSATAPLQASASATLTAPATPVSGLTLLSGATIRVDGATGSAPTFSADGTVRLAGGTAAQVDVALSGSFTSAEDYRLDLHTAAPIPSWTPVDGLTLSPDLSGTITRKSGATTFAVSAQGAAGSPLATWAAPSGVTVAVQRISVGGDATLTDPGCSYKTGLVAALSGTLAVGDLSVAASGCISLSDGGWHVAATAKTASVVGVTLSDLVLDATRPAGGTMTVLGSGTAALSVGTFSASTTVTMSLDKGVFVIGGQLDATGLGLPSTSTYLAYASAPRKAWPTGLRSVGTGGAVDLPAGISLFGSLTLPSSVAAVLKKANFTLPADATVTFEATVPKGATGISFTAALAAPSGFPLLTLPSGATIDSAVITYANKTFGLTANGTVKGQDGSFAPVTLAVTISSTGDFTGSASVTGLSLFGHTINLSGSVNRSGGVISANVTGSIADPIKIGDATLSNVKISLGTDGLSASGTVAVASTSVTFAASFTSTTSYELSVSTTIRNWTPAPGVTVNAALTGALTRSPAGWSYDFAASPLSGGSLITITPANGVSLSLSSFELSNAAKPPAGCTLAAAGDTWLAVSGSLSVSLGGASGRADGAGCFDLTKPAFTMTVSVSGADFGGAGGKVTLGNLSVTVSKVGANFSVDGRARLNVQMPSGGQFSLIAIVSFGPDGFAIGGLADLSSYLGGSAAQAYLFYANTQMTVDTGDATIGKLKLRSGVTVGLKFVVGADVAKALKQVGLPIGQGSALAATVNLDLSNATITMAVALSFQQTRLFSLSNGTYLQLDSLALAMTLSPTQPSFGFNVEGTLHVPETVPGGAASDIGLKGGIRIGTELTAYLSVSNWNDALGLRGLNLKEFTLQGGITLTGLPLPSLAFAATVTGLPSGLANIIGYQQGAPMSIAVAIGQTNLLFDVKIGTQGSSAVALAPFSLFGKASLLEVNFAELYLSPTGATIGDTVYPPGFSLAFQGRVAGVDVEVMAKIDPINGTFYFKGAVGTISIGSLVIGPTTLIIDAGPSKFDMSFNGRIAIGPSRTTAGPVRFTGYLKADVTLAVGTSGIAAKLNFEASVAAGAYVPHSWCLETIIYYPCNWYWEDSPPLTVTANNIGFAVNSSGLTIDIPNTASSITFPWPKSPFSVRERSLTSAQTGVQTLDVDALGGLAPVNAVQPRPTIVGGATWQPTGSLGTGRTVSVGLALRDGSVLTAGGGTASGKALATAERYDPKTGGWSQTGSMATPRANPTSVELADGRVLVVGGDNGRGEVASAEIYSPKTGRWTAAGNMSLARQGASAALLSDGTVLVAGGHIHGTPVTRVDRFDPRTGKWSVAAALPTARAAAASAVLADGEVLIAGGMGTSGPLRTAVRYDPRSDSWLSTGSMAHPRFYAAATRLSDGSVLVSGGAAEAERYDATTNRWKSAGMQSTPGVLSSMVTLPDGDVLVAGGVVGQGSVTQVDRYHPATNRWSPATSLPSGRAASVASVLPNGSVLVAGGLADKKALSDSFVYSVKSQGSVPSTKYLPMAAGPAPHSPSSSWIGTWTWVALGIGLVILLVAFFFVMAHRRRPNEA